MARSPRALSQSTSTNNDLVASFGSHRRRLHRVRCNNRSTARDTQLPPFHHRLRRALPHGARLVCSVRTLSHGLYAYTFEKLSHSAWWQPWRRSLCSEDRFCKKRWVQVRIQVVAVGKLAQAQARFSEHASAQACTRAWGRLGKGGGGPEEGPAPRPPARGLSLLQVSCTRAAMAAPGHPSSGFEVVWYSNTSAHAQPLVLSACSHRCHPPLQRAERAPLCGSREEN